MKTFISFWEEEEMGIDIGLVVQGLFTRPTKVVSSSLNPGVWGMGCEIGDEIDVPMRGGVRATYRLVGFRQPEGTEMEWVWLDYEFGRWELPNNLADLAFAKKVTLSVDNKNCGTQITYQ